MTPQSAARFAGSDQFMSRSFSAAPRAPVRPPAAANEAEVGAWIRPKKYARTAFGGGAPGDPGKSERRSPSTTIRSPPHAVHERRAVFCWSVSCPHSTAPMTTARTDVYPSQFVGTRAGSSRKSSGGAPAPAPPPPGTTTPLATLPPGGIVVKVGRVPGVIVLRQLAAAVPNALD